MTHVYVGWEVFAVGGEWIIARRDSDGKLVGPTGEWMAHAWSPEGLVAQGVVTFDRLTAVGWRDYLNAEVEKRMKKP